MRLCLPSRARRVVTSLFSIALTAVVSVDVANAQYGALDLSFNPDPAVQSVECLAVQPDGKVLLSGYVQVGGISAPRLVRLTESGALDSSFAPQITTTGLGEILVQSDGRIIIAGTVSTPTDPLGPRVVRLHPDGTYDTSFASASSANGPLRCAALAPGGGVVVAGAFSTYAGTPRVRVAKISATGNLDTTFDPGTGVAGLGSQVRECVVQPDGRVVLGGDFLTYSGAPRRGLVRIEDNGDLDATFSPGEGVNGGTSLGFDGYVNSIALEPSGHMWIAGVFTRYYDWGVTRPFSIARLAPDGAPTPLYGTGATYVGMPAAINVIAIQPNGKLLVGGDFSEFNSPNSVTAHGLVRVSLNGHKDGTFLPTLSPPSIEHMSLLADGRAVIAGNFDTYAGVARSRLARIFTYSCYADGDGDGFGAGSPIPGNAPCSGSLKILGTDCDDTNPAVRPGATEVCNGIDDDCDSVIDEGFISTYCTAGTTVAGCVPAIRGEGAPSSQATSGFDLVVDNVPTQKMGLIFYGLSGIPSPQPWALGSTSYLCIFYPVNRTGAQNSGGSVGACDGELRIDFNAWRTANPTALGAPFAAGQVLYAQGWFRDAGAAKGTNLSDGLRFTLCD